MLTKEELDRYNRQIILPEFGEEAQEKIKLSSALIVGLGGLGSVSSEYLVASGIGRIGLIDNDIVSISNLQRQILYREDEVGMKKVERAKETLNRLNSNVEIQTYPCFLTEENAIDIIKDYDIIIDATDNFKTRYLINDVCIGLGKPFVYASIGDYYGQVAVFNFDNHSSCYRDLFPNYDELHNRENKNKGVMGVLPSIAASLQVNEAIKIITSTGSSLINKLLTFDILNNEFSTLDLKPTQKARQDSLGSFKKLSL
ncbi:MAG: moeZ [Bacteroidetes bacterium]|nr:moeZ [Bacteroidota bacterium]